MEKRDKQLREEEASRGGQPLGDTAELERCSQPLGARLTGQPREGNRCSRMTSVPQRWATSGWRATQGDWRPRAGPRRQSVNSSEGEWVKSNERCRCQYRVLPRTSGRADYSQTPSVDSTTSHYWSNISKWLIPPSNTFNGVIYQL